MAVSYTHLSFQNGVQGVIVQEPVREGETPAMKHMFIDIGAADETEALSMVSPVSYTHLLRETERLHHRL